MSWPAITSPNRCRREPRAARNHSRLVGRCGGAAARTVIRPTTPGTTRSCSRRRAAQQRDAEQPERRVGLHCVEQALDEQHPTRSATSARAVPPAPTDGRTRARARRRHRWRSSWRCTDARPAHAGGVNARSRCGPTIPGHASMHAVPWPTWSWIQRRSARARPRAGWTAPSRARCLISVLSLLRPRTPLGRVELVAALAA